MLGIPIVDPQLRAGAKLTSEKHRFLAFVLVFTQGNKRGLWRIWGFGSGFASKFAWEPSCRFLKMDRLWVGKPKGDPEILREPFWSVLFF